jgi:hypothetical protein
LETINLKKDPALSSEVSRFTLGNWILLFGKTERLYKVIPKKSVQYIDPTAQIAHIQSYTLIALFHRSDNRLGHPALNIQDLEYQPTGSAV